MKNVGIILALCALVLAAGCSEEAPKATNEDKANIERLAKEGIGARPVDGGGAPNAGGGNPMGSSQPAKTAEDAQPAPP